MRLSLQEERNSDTTRMNLEGVTLSEGSLTGEATCRAIPLTRAVLNRQIHRGGRQKCGSQGPRGGEGGELAFQGYWVSVWDNGPSGINVLEMVSDDGCAILKMYLLPLN